MLQQLGQSETFLGNLITVAAMVDDIFSLVILAVLQQLSADDDDDADDAAGAASTASPPVANQTTMPSPGRGGSSTASGWQVAKPVVVSVAFLAGGAVLIHWTPRVVTRVSQHHHAAVKEWLVASIVVLGAGLTLAAGYAGTTFLLGAFVAGMCFAKVPGAAEAMVRQAPVTEWLASIFFATIGLVIPVGTLFEPVALGYGLLYVLPAFLGKFVTGAFTQNVPDTLVVGFAMVGRGELG